MHRRRFLGAIAGLGAFLGLTKPTEGKEQGKHYVGWTWSEPVLLNQSTVYPYGWVESNRIEDGLLIVKKRGRFKVPVKLPAESIDVFLVSLPRPLPGYQRVIRSYTFDKFDGFVTWETVDREVPSVV